MSAFFFWSRGPVYVFYVLVGMCVSYQHLLPIINTSVIIPISGLQVNKYFVKDFIFHFILYTSTNPLLAHFTVVFFSYPHYLWIIHIFSVDISCPQKVSSRERPILSTFCWRYVDNYWKYLPLFFLVTLTRIDLLSKWKGRHRSWVGCAHPPHGPFSPFR